LELSFKQLALVVVLICPSSGRLDACKERGLRPTIVVEAVLAEEGQIPNTVCVPSVNGRIRDNRSDLIVVMGSFANA
jgi:hypothetical protein